MANLPNTAPAAAVLPSTNTLGSLALVTVRLWDAEGNASTPFLQSQLSGSTNWQSATLTILVDGAPYDPATRVAALPSGTSHTLAWNAMADLRAGVVTNVLLRVRAQDLMLVGDWSLPTPFQLNMAQSTNGIPSCWLLQYFGRTDVDPSADADGDGMSNYAEYIADTNPLDVKSYLHISVSLVPDGVKIDWIGGVYATQYLERSPSLGDSNELWLSIRTNPPPTPVSGSYTDGISTNIMRFYRIRAER